MIKTALVTTTINKPTFLNNILNSVLRQKKNKLFVVIVIGDKKTPKECRDYCGLVEKKYKTRVEYLDINKQNIFFKKYQNLYKMFPYNDAIRKLLGSLYVWIKYKKNIERVIYIDDDNYLEKNQNFIDGHEITGSLISGKAEKSKSKWLNIYEKLNVDYKIPIFPRGYPWKYRGIKNKLQIKKFIKRRVIAKCGFITRDPDIDAVSRLFWPINVRSVKNNKDFYFFPGTYTPFNDQNTSISREYIILYYKPYSAGRNSDIWTSYLICKMAEIYGELVSYGNPFLKQIRNKHDYWKDYELEKKHNISTDFFVELISKIRIKRDKSRYYTLLKICSLMIKEISKSLNKMEKSKTNDRHYQGFSQMEYNLRKKDSLQYIKFYFQEYVLWLRRIKKYKLI